MTNESAKSTLPWMAGAFALVLVTAIALRYGTNVLDKTPVFDERYIIVPIEALVEQGWSVETAIDYTETKGPTMIWLYAAGGALLGSEINDLRLITVLLFVGGAVPLLLLCRQCGLEGPALPLAAGFYVLLPNYAPLGQLLMSEPPFMFGSLWLMWVFVWGFGVSRESQRSVAGPILFAVVLTLLLHLRVHAVAFAAGAVLVAFERDRLRSWPWWAACAAAGFSRLPLMMRWGGLVAPEYQTAHGLGLNLDGLTYLSAAMVPLVAIFLWPALREARFRRRRHLILIGAGTAVLLTLVAAPSMSDTISVAGREDPRYLGMVATLVRTLEVPHRPFIGALAVIGLAGLAALAAIGWDRPPGDPRGAVHRLQVWVLLTGGLLYVLTRGAVYDRYLLPWAILLPLLWVISLPRAALALQGVMLAAVNARFVWRLLIRIPP